MKSFRRNIRDISFKDGKSKRRKVLIPKSYCVKSFWNLFVWDAKSPKLLKSTFFESSGALNNSIFSNICKMLNGIIIVIPYFHFQHLQQEY